MAHGREVDIQDPWWRSIGTPDAARRALGEECAEEDAELRVVGSLELELVRPVLVNEEDGPVRHVRPDKEIHVENVPSGVLNARGICSVSVGDGGRGEDAIWDDLHVRTDRNTEGRQRRPRGIGTKTKVGEPLVRDGVAVERRGVAGHFDHGPRLLVVKLATVRVSRNDLADLCWQIDRPGGVCAHVHEGKIGVAAEGDVVFCKKSSANRKPRREDHKPYCV